MSIGRIQILITICIGVVSLPKVESKFLKLILLGFILSFLSSFFENSLVNKFSMLSFGLLVLAYSIYAIYNKKVLTMLISIFALASFIFKIQHWPYGSEIRASMLIPFIIFLVILFNLNKYKDHIYITSIIVAYEVSELLNLFGFNPSLSF